MLIRLTPTALPLVGQFKIGIARKAEKGSAHGQQSVRHVEDALRTSIWDRAVKNLELVAPPAIAALGKIAALVIIWLLVSLEDFFSSDAIHDVHHANECPSRKRRTPTRAENAVANLVKSVIAFVIINGPLGGMNK